MGENRVVGFGLPLEQKDFLVRHQLFFERHSHLKCATEIGFLRTLESSEPSDSVVFYLGRLCVKDFSEIILLCGNGYGLGGMRLLRGMYERAVTARYLHLHPDAAEDYLDYYWVTKHKEAQALRETFGADALPKDKLDEVETQFSRVREKFLVTDCKKCGTTRLNHTWTKLDLVSMARQTGRLGTLIVPAYYLPLEQAHSTPGGIVSRLEGGEEVTSFKGDPQREDADSCLLLGHHVLLDVLLLQQEHFGLDALAEPLKKCFQDFSDIWGKEPREKIGE